MDSRYPPPSRSLRWMLVVASILAISGCSFEMTRPCADGQGGHDAGGGPCSCGTPGASRCAGNTVQSCQRGGWTAQLVCRGSEVCVQGACVTAGTGCPEWAWVEDTTIVRAFAPVFVSDCIPGGDIGREAVYKELQSETHQRELTLSLEDCPDPSLDFSQIFGMDVEASVSSESLQIFGTIPPGKFGAFYRQTREIHRLALLWRHDNDLGDQVFVGTALLADYMFIPDFAIGDTCAPPSNFSPSSSLEFCVTWMDDCRCEE